MNKTVKNFDPASFVGLRPILCVDNVAQSIEFYTNKLGFELGFAYDDDQDKLLIDGVEGTPTFAQIGYGQHVQIMLCEQNQGNPGTWLHIDLVDRSTLQRYANIWSSNGVEILKPLTEYPWGNVEVLVRDPDQHVMRMSAHASS